MAVLTSLTDQCLARERAANYFALLDVFKKPEIAGELWEVLERSWDLNRPFVAGIAIALGRFDADDAVLLAAREQVVSGLATLRSGDMVLERSQPGYPRLLEASGDAPRFLFVRQEMNVLELLAIAVVGTREVSDDGKARARMSSPPWTN